MRKLSACFFQSRVVRKHSQSNSQSFEETMENRQSSNDSGRSFEENSAVNIISNHDFSEGMKSWHPNGCHGYISSGLTSYPEGVTANTESRYAVVSNRTECWQGLEQDITSKVFPSFRYSVSACVCVRGAVQGCDTVQATLKLDHPNGATSFLFVGRTLSSNDQWGMLEGTFSLESLPKRVVFYLEGPSPGVDLLIDSVSVSSSCTKERETVSFNIISNHDFSEGLKFWHTNCCHGYVASGGSNYLEGVIRESHYAVISNRTESWQGLEQDITGQVSAGSIYRVSARVCVRGVLQGFTCVQATLKLEYSNEATKYLSAGRITMENDQWDMLEGTFSLDEMPNHAVFFLEGPSPGEELLIDSVIVSLADGKDCEEVRRHLGSDHENIILNPQFDDGLNNWSGRGCKISLHDSMGSNVFPVNGKLFASTSERRESWNGIQQDITGRVQRKLAYELTALVRLFGTSDSYEVRATLWVLTQNQREQYIGIASSQVSSGKWVSLQGKFLINSVVSKAIIYLEGPSAGIDILLDSLVVYRSQVVPPSPPPPIDVSAFGVNIIQNSNLEDRMNGWFSLGSCTMSVASGSPRELPPMAKKSLGPHQSLSGCYILVTNRTQNWMGPAQMITDKLKLYMTYQVSAWVRVSAGKSSPQNVNVALSVDNQWVNGGQAEVDSEKWHEIAGSFRIEKRPSEVMAYVQGPAPGIELMVAGLQIFAVNRQARIKSLRMKIDEVRTRDVTLKFSTGDARNLAGTSVKVSQVKNSFPLGSCIMRTNIDNEDFVNFFHNIFNFEWTVFGNELKWMWTESQRGNFNYKDADELLDFCKKNNVKARGHCIFWDVVSNVQQWVQSLNRNDLTSAIQNRLTGLLNRYKGRFLHYDVNNEMLHGSFFPDKLGKGIRASMFKTAHQLDPSPLLFVNDYHVEDGCDSQSSPAKYIAQILDLQVQGAPIGGIGIQAHIDSPVGSIVSSALDELGTLKLPIWFTELDVVSNNEYVRADDLEVMLWEAFAHPAVEGIMLWGFWELFMCRNNSHLVSAEGVINEAGKRLLAIRKQWLSQLGGNINDRGEFTFRGFLGDYIVEITNQGKKLSKKFTVGKKDSPMLINIEL